MASQRWQSIRTTIAACCIAVVVALVAISCGDPQVPVAVSTSTTPVAATPTPEPPTPTALPTPTPLPTALPDEPTPVPTPTAEPAPGLSTSTIRIAVIFDDQTGGTADGLFADSFLGTLAWQQLVNQREPNGIGGRTVDLVPFDARMANHEQVLLEVCNGDFFAMVGSQSLGDGDGSAILGTDECDIPDFAAATHSPVRAASPVTFVPNPFLNDTRQAGPARWLAQQFPDAAQKLALFRFNALDLEVESERLRETLVRGAGMTVTFGPQLSLQEDFADRIIPAWEDAGAQSLVWNADADRLIDLLSQLETPPEFVLCELGCYSENFIARGGEAVEGVYVWIPHVPFGSPNSPAEMVNYQRWLERVAPEKGWSEVGFQSWLSGRLFEESMERLMSVEESFGRDQLLAAARTVNAFNGEGVLVGFTDPANGIPSSCFTLMVVAEGEWQQAHPEPPAEIDCDPGNLFDLIATRQFGLLAEVDAEASLDDLQPEATPTSDIEAADEVPE